jgi:hypothetical protein
VSFVLFFSFLFTTTTHAYLMTNQSAHGISPHSALFLIEYKFGTKNNALHMPIRTLQGTTAATNTLAYQIHDEDGNIVPGKTSAIVLSDAKFSAKESMYITDKGFSKKFTLVSVFTPDVYDPEKKYRLQVTHLPFSFNGTQELQLNPSELQYYTTDLVSL